MATTLIKGEGLILSIWDGVSAYEPIACLTSNSLNRTRAIIEATTKCDPGTTIRQAGSASYEIPFEGLYIDTTSVTGDTTKVSHDSLMDIFDANTEQDWRLSTGLADTQYYYGSAFFTDLNMDAASGDEFTSFSGTLSGTGSIVKVDPNAP